MSSSNNATSMCINSNAPSRFTNTHLGSHPHINIKLTCTHRHQHSGSLHINRKDNLHAGSHPNQNTCHFSFLESQTQSSFTPCAHCKTSRLHPFAPCAHCRAIKLQRLNFLSLFRNFLLPFSLLPS